VGHGLKRAPRGNRFTLMQIKPKELGAGAPLRARSRLAHGSRARREGASEK
jgi:hypothetical protein